MPIRPENKSRYPADWKLRSRFIREYRAKNCCEWCGIRNYSVGWREKNGDFLVFSMPDTYAQAREIADTTNRQNWFHGRVIVIVLTVAHIHDHDPENCSFLNLAALCQRCHLNHDRDLHAANRVLNRQFDSKQMALL